MILVGDRITRDGSKVIGELRLCHDTASTLANDGVGVFVEEADFERQIQIIPHMVRNACPWKSVVAAHSYESIDRLLERCHEWGVNAYALGFQQRSIPASVECDVFVAIPESLYVLAPLIRKRKVLPNLLVTMDPLAINTTTREWNGRRSRRAENVATLKSVALAAGVSPLSVYLCGARAASMFMDNVRLSAGVESLQFVRASSLRVADLLGLSVEMETRVGVSHWLDAPITKLGKLTHRGGTILLVGGHFAEREELLKSFGTRRGYPMLNIKSLLESLSQIVMSPAIAPESLGALRRSIQAANKRVVILSDTNDAYQSAGVSATPRLLSVKCPGTIVLAAGPSQWDHLPAEQLNRQEILKRHEIELVHAPPEATGSLEIVVKPSGSPSVESAAAPVRSRRG